ncbi:MAG: hypothetical protein R3F30_10810 [Planctomycetota bacterium]
MTDHSLHVVFGASGPLGRALVDRLHAEGEPVRAVHRRGDMEAPAGVDVVAGDAADPEGPAWRDAGVAYCCVGFPGYARWPELWPPVVDGLLAGAARTGARLVFADNLYAYGPVDAPMRADQPAREHGRKPALRARLARRMLDADAAGRVRVALVRGSDFYGPWVREAMLGERVFGNVLAGRPAELLFDADQPHSYAFIDDYARALVSVARDEGAFGRVWHVPHAGPLTTRGVVERVHALAGKPVRIRVVPPWMVTVLGLFVPVLREFREMRFVWDRPYVVDSSAYEARFREGPTPLDEGLTRTLAWYRDRA